MASRLDIRTETGMVFPQRELSFSIFVSDISPDGLAHTSPELRRANFAGVQAQGTPTPHQQDHAHPGHDLIIVMHGNGVMRFGDHSEVHLAPGHLLFVSGGTRHGLVVDGHICIYGIYFSPEYFRLLPPIPEMEELRSKLSQTEHPVPVRLFTDPSAFRTFQNIFEECLVIYGQAGNPCQAAMLQTFGQLVALLALNLFRDQQLVDHPASQRVLEIKTWIDRHLFEPMRVQDLAQMANLSQSRFCTLFRETVGFSPKAYVLSRRLQFAANLLAESQLPVTSIAQYVGFNDLTNFIHAFKGYSTLTPSDYRKRYQRQ